MKLENAIATIGGLEHIILFPDIALSTANRTRGIGQATRTAIRRKAIDQCVTDYERGELNALDRLREVNKFW